MAYRVGEGTAMSIPYMLELLVTQGRSSVGRGLIKWAVKRYGKRTLKSGIGKVALGGVKLLGGVGDAAVQTIKTGMNRGFAGATERMTPGYELGEGENGELTVVTTGKPELSAGRSLGEAFFEQAKTYWVERAGGDILGKVFDGAKKGLSKLGERVGVKFKASDARTVWDDFVKKTGWHGTPAEYAEEVLDQILSTPVTEQTLDNDEQTGIFTVENQVTTALTCMVIGTMMNAPNAVAHKGESKRMELMRDSWSKQGEVLLGKNWGDIRAKIDGATANDLSAIVSEIVGNPHYSTDQKRVVLRYAGAMAQDQALINAEEQQEMTAKSERVIDAQQWVEAGFNEGYDATSAESRRAVAEQAQEAQRGAMEAIDLNEGTDLAQDLMTRYGSKSINEISAKVANDESLQPQQKQAIYNYLASLKRIQGMQKRHADEVEMAERMSDAIVASNTNRQSGAIVKGTMKVDDRQVYVINGEVKTHDDGTIDEGASAQELVVRDVKTGEEEMISPQALIGVETYDAEEVRMAQAQALVSQVEQEYDNAFAPVEGNAPVLSPATQAPTAPTNADMGGLTVKAKIKGSDKEVYVVGGEVYVKSGAEQEANMDNSDESVVIVDANGNKEMVSPSMLYGIELSREESAPDAEAAEQAPSTQVTEVAEESTERPMEIAPGVRVRMADGTTGVATSFPEDGKVLVRADDGKVHQYDELSVMADSSQPETTEPNEVEPAGVADGSNESDGTNGANDTKESQSTASPLGTIPVDEKGEPMYESAPVEATIANIYNDPDLSEDEADAFVQAKIDGATKRIADLEGKQPKMGEDLNAFKAEKAQWQAEMDAQRASLAYWQGVQEARAKQSTTSPLQGTPPISQGETRGELGSTPSSQGDTSPIAAQPGGELDANGEMGEIGEISTEAEGDTNGSNGSTMSAEDSGEGKKMSVEEARAKAEAERAAREKARDKAKAAGKRAEERARNRGDYRKAMAQWEDAPGSFYEYVAQALLAGDHKMRWNDVGSTRGLGRHTTGRRGRNRRGEVVTQKNEESKLWSWLIDDRGGMSPEKLAERLWNEYTGSYGEDMSEGSPLDVLLDVVTSMPTARAMWDYVKGEHDARMEAEQGAYEEQYSAEEIEAFERDAMYREKYGVSEEEYWANEAQWDEFIESREMSAEEWENYDNFVAEERKKEEHGRKNQENEEDEQRTDNSESEGGVEVLSGTQPDITRGDEDVAGESEGVDGNGVESNDVAQEEAAELSEEDRQAIENMPIPMLKRQIKDTATTLFNVYQTSDQWQAENKDKIERAKLLLAYAKQELARKERLKKSNKWGVKVGNTATPFDVVRKMFEEFNSNEDLAQLFEKVAKVFETLPIKVVFSDTIGGKSTQGWFSPTTGTLKLPGYFVYGGGISEQNKAETILHEMIHAVTTYALYINEKPYLQTELGFRLSDDMHAAIRQLKRIYASIANDKDFKGEYGAVSVHEMIAELSNVQFREKLKKKGLWETIVDAIKQLFGITPSNALEGAEAALEYMLNNFDRSQWEKMAGMGEKRGKQMRIGVEKMGSSFEYFTGTLTDLISIAKNAVKGLFKKVIAPVSSRLKEDLATKGIVIDDEYNHVIDNNAIRHILKKHSGKNEVKRGQIPVVDADFDKITDIVESYDIVEVLDGNTTAQRIIYQKSYSNGIVMFVEEQRAGRKELAAVTMWKKKNPTLTDANRTETTQISDLNEVSTDKGSDNIGDVQGLEDYSAEELKEIAREYIEDIIAESGFDAEVVDLAIYGSRRRGDGRDDSDLDIVVEYSGYAREDDLFNALNDAETQLEIDGVKVDINPITKSKSGTLGEFMERVREYDEGNEGNEPNGSAKESQSFTNPSAFGTSPKTGEESGGSLEDDGLLFRDGEVFYSNAEEAVRNIKQEKATPEQWLAMIQKNGGLKAGEDKWLGLSDWLKASDAKTLTKEEVLEFIAQNKIKIEEVGYGGDSIASAQSEFDELAEELGGYDEAFEEMENRYGDDFREAVWYDEVGQLHLEEGYEDYGDILGGERGINPTRMSYTTEGLENNKEIALVVPSVDPYNAHDEIHFGDAGGGRAVAWVRFGETRVPRQEEVKRSADELEDPYKNANGRDVWRVKGRKNDYIAHSKLKNGMERYLIYVNDKLIGTTLEDTFDTLEEAQAAMNRYYAEHPVYKTVYDNVLVIDEIQSKRHQDGREKGYRDAEMDKRAEEARKAYIEADKAFNQFREQLMEKYNYSSLVQGTAEERREGRKIWRSKFTPEEMTKYDQLHNKVIDTLAAHDNLPRQINRVPDAPFEKNWHELAMKRMLRYAAENGFDKVAWTTGVQQAERYDIGKVVDRVERDDDGVLVRTYNGDISIDFDENGKITSGQYTGNTLAEVFGKELATKIMSMESGEVLEEDGLRIGGEGMKGFYDKMLPSFMNKYGKKWGVKVGEVTMPNIGDGGLTMHSIDVTDAMRESVMEGQPMFRDGSGALSDADLSYANDPIAKVMGKSQRSKKQQAKFAERERKYMRNRVAELAEKMHLDNVEVVESSLSTPSPSSTPQSQSTPSPFRGTPPKQGSRGELNASNGGVMSERKARAKGWFDTRTGKIVINISNHTSVADVERTLLHEAVAHYGLRQLFGKQFDTFLDNVYRSAEADIRAQIVELAKKHGWEFRTATEEYLAGLAEDTNFEYLEYQTSFWMKIKRFFMDMLESIGWDYKGPELSDNELRYLLWRSYENMVNPGRHRSILGKAEDVAKQYALGVGNYSADAESMSQVAEEGEDRVDNQGNPIDENGKLIVEEVSSIDEITDADFDSPTRSIQLPSIPPKVDEAIGANGKPIVIKKNVFEKNKKSHKDLTPKDSRAILINTLYSPDLYGQNQKITRPYNWILIHLADTNTAVLVEVNENKDNVEIVNWHYINDDAIERKKKQAIREGGLILTLESAAADTSNFLPSADKVNNNNSEKQENNESNESNGSSNAERDSDEGILFRDGESDGTREEYNRRVRRPNRSGSVGKWDNLGWRMKEAYQDSMLSLKELQDVVAKKYGLKEIPSWMNAYLQENLMSSRNKAASDVYMRDFYNPMMKEVQALIKKGVKYEDLVNYMIAKHGLERNVVMAERDAKRAADEAKKKGEDWQKAYDEALKENRKRDYSGLTALTGEESVMTAEKVAEKMVEEFEGAHETDALWEKVNAATKETLRKSYEGGLMSKETYESTEAMYEHYIPLRGWDSDIASDVYEYLMSDRPLLSPALKTAKGRTSLADDPIATIGMMADSTIAQANRNKMKQAFYYFAVNNPSDVVTISKQWYVYDEVTKKWQPRSADIPLDASSEEIATIVEEFEARMEELARDGKAKRKSQGLDLDLRTVGREGEEHTVRVKVNGEEYCIYVNGSPRAAQALNGLTNPEMFNDALMKGTKKVNNYLAQVFTSNNPEFVFSNMSRDLMWATGAVAVKENAKYNATYHKNINKIFWSGTMPRLVHRHMMGTLNMNNELDRYFEEFVRHGGETGYTAINSIEHYKRNIKRSVKDAQGKRGMTKKVWNGVFDAIEFMNRSAENMTRFAVYVTSREMGRDQARAAHDAKEITVNFNKKGSGELGARYLGGLYVFMNACIQSMANFARLTGKHPVKMTGTLVTMAGLGFMLPMLNRMLAEAMGDDDEYWNLPEWVRRNNLVFRIPGTNKFITLPISHELRPFYGIGEIAYSVMNEKEDAKEGLGKAVLGFSGMSPINFTGNGGNVAVNLTPSAFQPVAQLVANVDYFGKPIFKDADYLEDYPEYTKAYKGTSPMLVSGTEFLNRVSGGDAVVKGDADLNPDVIEHLVESYFGGAGKTVNKAIKGFSMIWDEDTREVRNIPIVNKFLQTAEERTSGSSVNKDYFEALQANAIDAHKVEGYGKQVERGNLEYKDKYDEAVTSPGYRAYKLANGYKEAISIIEKYLPEASEEDAEMLKQSVLDFKKEMLDEISKVEGMSMPDVNAKVKTAKARAKMLSAESSIPMRIRGKVVGSSKKLGVPIDSIMSIDDASIDSIMSNVDKDNE